MLNYSLLNFGFPIETIGLYTPYTTVESLLQASPDALTSAATACQWRQLSQRLLFFRDLISGKVQLPRPVDLSPELSSPPKPRPKRAPASQTTAEARANWHTHGITLIGEFPVSISGPLELFAPTRVFVFRRWKHAWGNQQVLAMFISGQSALDQGTFRRSGVRLLSTDPGLPDDDDRLKKTLSFARKGLDLGTHCLTVAHYGEGGTIPFQGGRALLLTPPMQKGPLVDPFPHERIADQIHSQLLDILRSAFFHRWPSN